MKKGDKGQIISGLTDHRKEWGFFFSKCNGETSEVFNQERDMTQFIF